AGGSTFKYDLGSEDREGHQDSTVSVFTRDADGTLHHFYTAHPWMASDIRERGIDLLAPIWHFMDLTSQGRGNWYTTLDYGTKAHAASTQAHLDAWEQHFERQVRCFCSIPGSTGSGPPSPLFQLW